ncbi:hypothetical protein ACWD5Q_05820 [Streptomyces sp. NPDC002513]
MTGDALAGPTRPRQRDDRPPLGRTVGGAAPAMAWTPLAAITEADDAYRMEIGLPGVTSEGGG